MCGIVGFIGNGNQETLVAMADAIRYRGPDDVGYFFDGRIGLGHLRLSIIDVSSAGHQPMWDDRKEIGVVFNGEIYNFKELRGELEKKGIKFISGTDTEVLIYAYREWGTGAFSKIEGMCAAAIYDRRSNTVILVRDRLGKKPLYVGHFGETIIFASEPKAIFKHSASHKELNVDALNYFLQYESVPGSYSIYKNVRKVLPSHFVVIKDGVIEGEYEYGRLECANIASYSVEEAIQRLDELMSASVKKRLVSDVPLGVFLSGGLDSSTIAWYAREVSGTPPSTFSIGFNEKSFDESQYARLVAQHLHTSHFEEVIRAEDACKIIPELYRQIDEPLADASIIPTYFLSKMTREHVTVALGGDGGDELFLGYQTFVAHKIALLLRMFPSIVPMLCAKLAQHIPVGSDYFSFGFKAQHFFKGFEFDSFKQDVVWRGSFGPQERTLLLSPNVRNALSDPQGFKPVYDVVSSCNDAAFWNTLSYFYLKQYLPDDILVKVDRASMYQSLEVRAPFLDTTLIDFALSLPPKMKLHGLNGKWILKKLMRGRLPDVIIDRPKKGFALPVSDWLRTELKDECRRVFDPTKIRSEGLFNPDYITSLLQAHQDGKKDYRKELWTLLTFEWWKEHHGA